MMAASAGPLCLARAGEGLDSAPAPRFRLLAVAPRPFSLGGFLALICVGVRQAQVGPYTWQSLSLREQNCYCWLSVKACAPSPRNGYHVLHAQYRAFHRGPGFVSQWWRARNEARCLGYCALSEWQRGCRAGGTRLFHDPHVGVPELNFDFAVAFLHVHMVLFSRPGWVPDDMVEAVVSRHFLVSSQNHIGPGFDRRRGVHGGHGFKTLAEPGHGFTAVGVHGGHSFTAVGGRRRP